MDLNEIQYFKHVAEQGSFSRASRLTSIPKSTLSRKVSELENRLGVTLFRRTTRQVTLTDAGISYFQTCSKVLAELESAENQVKSGEDHPKGKLRVAAPVDIGGSFIAAVTADFCQKYPEIELEFLLDDEVIDLIREKVDIGVRAGFMPDSSLKAQRLGISEFQLYASPQYLKKFGEPKTPKDLEQHHCLLFTSLDKDGTWSLINGHARQKVHLKKVILSNQLSMVKTLAIHGAGIALIPVFLGVEEEQKKQLVRVLKNWGTDREPVYAVYPDQPYVPQRTRLFLECLKKAFS